MPEYRGELEAQHHPAIRNGLDIIIMEYAARKDFVKRTLKQYDDLNEAYKVIENYDSIKKPNVANGMTLEYRIWDLSEEDRKQAEADYAAARDAMDFREYERQLASGNFNVRMFDKSFKYRYCLSNYVAKKGKINGKEKAAPQNEHDTMVERVLADTTFLFTTASNCGGRLLDRSRSFVPTVIAYDEAG